ncbi:serine/threonine protein kinase [bacterium]|nr:serine/threonine protein kinase [bacterium]
MLLEAGVCALIVAGGLVTWQTARHRASRPAPPPPPTPVPTPTPPPKPEQAAWLRAAPAEPVAEDDGTLGEALGPYKILSTLGRGGMATVYKALDTRNERQVALKVVSKANQKDQDFMRRFEREVEITGRLKHANLIELYEASTFEGRLCMALELAEGMSLEDLLKSGPLPLEDFPIIACQIAAGLHYAHRQGLFHRDIKPANIFVGRDALVKVLDFGLAIAHGHSRFTSVGFSMGTPTHMAPEGLKTGVSDADTDQWALGVVFYQILTGRLPFESDNPMELARQIVKEEPVPPSRLRPGIPPRYDEIVLRMLAKEPDHRFDNLAEVRSLLNAALVDS